MELTDLLGPEDIVVPLKANCKKQVLNDLADFASRKTGIAGRRIFETLLERERLGSTGVGNGIAIPHGKINGLEGISGFFAVLDTPIDYDALDDQPVDIVFLLLAPEESGAEHLKALARIARLLREPDMVNQLREAGERATVYSLLTHSRETHAA